MHQSNKSLPLIFILSFGFLFLKQPVQSQTKCNCPPIKLYVYDTKMGFSLEKDADAVDAGKYVEAQNSGDWLFGACVKQRSEEFQVYKGLRPGATQVKTYELPPPDGGSSENGIDFTSYAEVTRVLDVDGKYSYTAALKIYDSYRHTWVQIIAKSTDDLGKVDDLIDEMISSYSPVVGKLRDYQEEVRDKSGNMWIGLKFKAIAEKTKLKVGETTKIHIKVFDCADEKPVPNQQLNIRVGSPSVGFINLPKIKSNSSGEATVIFTATDPGETYVFPDFTYTAVNGKTGYHVLDCGDLKTIQVTTDNRNYFYLGSSLIPGTLYEVKEPLLASLRTSQDRADYVNDQWNIMVNGMRKMNDSNSAMQPMSMLITVTQSDTGTYKWTIYGNCSKGLTPPCNTVQVMGSGSDGSPFQYGSFDCTGCESENCKLIATEGSTTISVFDKKNKIIKGYFSGTLVSPNHQSVNVSGAFSVSIQ